jgi:hypothetical protein
MKLFGYGSKGLIVVDRDHIKEFFDAPEGDLSFEAGFVDGLSLREMFNGDPSNDYHKRPLQGELTQNIAASMPYIIDELSAAFADEFDLTLGEGKPKRNEGLSHYYRICTSRCIREDQAHSHKSD